jgi:hypothetical protein
MEPCEHCSDVYIKTGDHPAFQSAKPITNYERLIRKTPEEMAAWIADHPVVSEYDENNPQHKAWLDWLKQEVDE